MNNTENMNRLTKEELAEALKGLPVGEIHCFDAIGSTNDFGFECSAAGAPDMTIITAYEQTKGRGRMQREWITKPGSSLPMTVIIRPTAEEMANLNLFSPLTGLAVREGLLHRYAIESKIKWPNDVLLKSRKICGILCESQWEGDRLNALILGIGINLLHGSAPELPDLNYPASSVEDETGTVIPRAEWGSSGRQQGALHSHRHCTRRFADHNGSKRKNKNLDSRRNISAGNSRNQE